MFHPFLVPGVEPIWMPYQVLQQGRLADKLNLELPKKESGGWIARCFSFGPWLLAIQSTTCCKSWLSPNVVYLFINRFNYEDSLLRSPCYSRRFDCGAEWTPYLCCKFPSPHQLPIFYPSLFSVCLLFAIYSKPVWMNIPLVLRLRAVQVSERPKTVVMRSIGLT